MIVKALRFNARVSAFRNVRFDFTGTMEESYKIFVGYGLLVPLTLGLLFPFVQARSTSFMFSRHRYGNADFHDALPTSEVYAICGIVLLLMLVVFAVPMATVAMFTLPEEGLQQQDVTAEDILRFLVPLYAVILLGLVFIHSFISTRMTNLLMNNAGIGTGVRFVSRVRTLPLFWIHLAYGLLTIATLGLAYPWLKVRRMQYRAKCTTVEFVGTLDGIVDEIAPAGSAAADQLGEAFDVDFDLGF